MICIISQVMLSFLGAMGFALIFEVPYKYLIPASLGGVVCWGSYLVSHNLYYLSVFVSALISSMLTSFYAEIVSGKSQIPSPVIRIPSFIPLIPGSGLYYTMSSMVSKQWEMMKQNGVETIGCAFGMALGMSLVFAIIEIRKMVTVRGTQLPRGNVM